MGSESKALSTNACLERRTAYARRRAYAGDLAGAQADYAALWPQTTSMSPGRRLRFLGQYADVLGRQECLLAFERIRGLAEEAERLCTDFQGHSDTAPAEAQNIKRHVDGVLGALLKVTRRAGDDSAIGQVALRRAWALNATLSGESGRRNIDGRSFRAVQENGRTVWMVKEQDRFRLQRRVHRA